LFKHPNTFSQKPKRIISLVPSITELLFSLGLEDETIAITKFCVHPKQWHKIKTRIGGTKNVQIDTIKNLQPDLIICSKEENVKEQIDELAENFPVLLTDVKTYDDALEMIKTVGKICRKEKEAIKIANNIELNFSTLKIEKEIQTAYLIWHKPYMTIGNDTFINAMMQKVGLVNVFAKETRYPIIITENLMERKPNLILLSSEPYPFKQEHINELQTHLPDAKIVLADGEFFSWYGSRMLDAPKYFQTLLLSI
jgi:ABC-type Fe3+-hydroxamate transport system substrate-binding protein